MTERTIRIYSGAEALSEAAARLFTQTAEQCVASKGHFVVALSGGQSPQQTYRLLAQAPYRERVAWEKTHLFWGDERCVPQDDPRSNAGMVFEALLSHVPIPPGQIHPIPTKELPEKCASAYEKLLRDFFQDKPPRFDLIFLGLGEDGHTAALFPRTSVLEEHNRWVRDLYMPEQGMSRVTLTPLIINQATRIVFLVQGSNKSRVVQEVLAGSLLPRDLPAQLIGPDQGELMWLLDEAAASGLPPEELETVI